jgi:ankyrin repeat protein
MSQVWLLKNDPVTLWMDAVRNGHAEDVDRLLRTTAVDPSVEDNYAVAWASGTGNFAVVERLLQDKRVDASARDNCAIRAAAANGHIAIVERLLQEERVDPSAMNNYAIQLAAFHGRSVVVDRLLKDGRVDPSAEDNLALRWAHDNNHQEVFDRLLEDDRVDVTVAIQRSVPGNRKRFECRERLTEICVGLQAMQLPAWVTIKILKAARPWSTLQLHSKWALVCAVKHFHDKRQK